MDKDKLAERVERLFEEHNAYLEFINGEKKEIKISRPELEIEETKKDNVITKLLKRIANLEYEVERLNNIINEVVKDMKEEINFNKVRYRKNQKVDIDYYNTSLDIYSNRLQRNKRK